MQDIFGSNESGEVCNKIAFVLLAVLVLVIIYYISTTEEWRGGRGGWRGRGWRGGPGWYGRRGGWRGGYYGGYGYGTPYYGGVYNTVDYVEVPVGTPPQWAGLHLIRRGEKVSSEDASAKNFILEETIPSPYVVVRSGIAPGGYVANRLVVNVDRNDWITSVYYG